MGVGHARRGADRLERSRREVAALGERDLLGRAAVAGGEGGVLGGCDDGVGGRQAVWRGVEAQGGLEQAGAGGGQGGAEGDGDERREQRGAAMAQTRHARSSVRISATRSAVGVTSSSAIRPSARKTTRWA